MRYLLACTVPLLLSACLVSSGGTNSTDEPLPIRLINDEIAKGCEFTGPTTGHVYNAFQYPENNIADARMKAASEVLATGGNAAVITATDVERPGHNVTVNMDAYNCPG